MVIKLGKQAHMKTLVWNAFVTYLSRSLLLKIEIWFSDDN
jgi:hypothetical protein